MKWKLFVFFSTLSLGLRACDDTPTEQQPAAAQPVDYHNSIPADPIKRRTYQFMHLDPRNEPSTELLNCFKKYSSECLNENIGNVATQSAHCKDQTQENYLGHHYAHPEYQILLEQTVQERGTHLPAPELCAYASTAKHLADTSKNTVIFAGTFGPCIWLNQKELAPHSLPKIKNTFHHELTHYIEHDQAYERTVLQEMFRLENKVPTETLANIAKFQERRADTIAAEYSLKPSHLSEKQQYRVHDDSPDGYIGKNTLHQFECEAILQDNQQGKCSFVKALDAAGKTIHGHDPQLNKLGTDALTKEHEEFQEFKQTLNSSTTPDTFEDCNNHKMDMLLAEHRTLQFNSALLTNQLYNQWGRKRLQVMRAIFGNAITHQALHKAIHAANPGKAIRFLPAHTLFTELQHTDTRLHHLDLHLKEQAYINARVYGQELPPEQQERYFTELKADVYTAQNTLVKRLRSQRAVYDFEGSSDYHRLNVDWVDQEIKKAQWESDTAEVERLQKIRVDYQEQEKEKIIS